MKLIKSNSGNAFFLILIAVALFAALSYAVTSSSRSSGNDANDESNQLVADTIVNYAIAVRTAVQRMILSGNCEIHQINFSYDGDSSPSAWNTGNVHSPADKSCHVFDFASAGGKVPPARNVPAEWLDSSLNSKWNYGYWAAPRPRAITTLGQSGDYDLIFVLPYLKKEICDSINDVLKIKGLVYLPSILDDRHFPDTDAFNPYRTITPTYDGYGGSDLAYDGMFCAQSHNTFESNSNIEYDFVVVLHIR